MRKMPGFVRHPEPLTLPSDATVQQARRCVREGRVGAVLVAGADRRLVGIFTARDAAHRVLAEGKSAVARR